MELTWAASPPIRERSKLVFGQELRLALCLYVGRHPDQLFTLTRASQAIGVTPSALQAPLESLVGSQFVSAAERVRTNTREKWLRREASLLWRFAEELVTSNPEGQLALDFSAD